jgi:hypothetical protein
MAVTALVGSGPRSGHELHVGTRDLAPAKNGPDIRNVDPLRPF